MNGPEKSDSPIVAVKPANDAARAAEEQVEPRGGIKENADQQPRSGRRAGKPCHMRRLAYERL